MNMELDGIGVRWLQSLFWVQATKTLAVNIGGTRRRDMVDTRHFLEPPQHSRGFLVLDLSIYPSIHLSIYPSIYISFFPPIFLSILWIGCVRICLQNSCDVQPGHWSFLLQWKRWRASGLLDWGLVRARSDSETRGVFDLWTDRWYSEYRWI